MNHPQDRIVRMQVPLSPLIPGEPPSRIGPLQSLDIPYMLGQLASEILLRMRLCGSPWGLISVLSSYCQGLHVMLMELSKARYLAGPEFVPDGRRQPGSSGGQPRTSVDHPVDGPRNRERWV